MPTRWRTLAGSGRPRDAPSRFATSRRAVASSSASPSEPTAARTSSAATPRWRSSAESARRARPRPWCRVSTHASANRPRTASAISSGTRRRRSALASWARVRGPAASSRRQIWRAASSGSTPPSPAPAIAALPARFAPAGLRGWPGGSAVPLPDTTGEGDAGVVGQAGAGWPARHRIGDRVQVPALPRLATGRWVRIQARAHAELLLDLLLDLVGQVGVVAQEGAGVLLALSQLVALVGVPGAGLAHDPL